MKNKYLIVFNDRAVFPASMRASSHREVTFIMQRRAGTVYEIRIRSGVEEGRLLR